MLTVALVGRPNVGKSTLFNRLTEKRHALVDDQPGVTRDRRYGEGRIGPLPLRVIDTAGLEDAAEGTMEARMREQSEAAIREADVALLIIDGRAGLTVMDEFFANLIRKSGQRVILCVNKAEGGKASTTIADAYRLGFGEPVAISAEHGEGMADLYDALAPFSPENAVAEEERPRKRRKKKSDATLPASIAGEEAEWWQDEEEMAADTPPPIMQIAIVGRPNSGKSTLLNTLLGEERVLAGPEAGLTRDSIAVDFEHNGQKIKLVDTAGLRKRSNVVGKVERLAVADSLRAIQYAHVVFLLLDATAPLEKQDMTIASLVEQEGRSLVIALNKWDQVKQSDRQLMLNYIFARLSDVMAQVKGVPVVPISARHGTHLPKLLDAAFDIFKLWNARVSTGELNRWLEGALQQHSPPLVAGRRLKIRYVTQAKTRPPTFILFCNKGAEMPDSYVRYLQNSLRETFNLPGVPIRMNVRTRKNPYAQEHP